MPSADFRIAVIGAGVAGLVVAAALRRAGLSCQVFEQAPRLAEVGAGIQLAPNAVRLLHGLGLAEPLEATAVRPDEIRVSRWDDGDLIASTALGERCEQAFGAPYYTVLRSDLHSALLGLLPPDVVHLGQCCVGLAERTDDVELTFADGRRVTADLVVGADGIHSAVRRHLIRDEARFSGETIYRGLIPADRVPFLRAEPRVQLWLGPGRHCVAYPVAGGERVSFGATTPAGGWRAESWSAVGDAGEVRAAYDGWCPDVLSLLDAAESVGRWALHDRNVIARWSSERTVLLGDAAHPMLPFFAQGANQAIEDAVVLATCLHDLLPTGGMGAALRAYEALRKPRTDAVHEKSRVNTDVFHLPDGADQLRRDAELARYADLEHRRWLWGYEAESALSAAGGQEGVFAMGRESL